MRSLFLIILFLASCSKQQDVAPNISFGGREQFDRIDSNKGKQCLVLRRNILYDSAEGLKFKVKFVHILEDEFFPYSPFMGDDEELMKIDSTIIDSLNYYFYPQKMGFGIYEHQEYHSGELLQDFNSEFTKWQEYGVLTAVIYHTKSADYFAAASIGYPSNIIAIHSSVYKTKSPIHEFGHAFGLPHIFEPDHTDGHNAYWGDQICDTPSVNIMDPREYSVNNKCQYSGQREYSDEDLSILIHNYMSYNNDVCRRAFTPLQGLTMRWHTEKIPLLNSALY